jgi:hypothetical protein
VALSVRAGVRVAALIACLCLFGAPTASAAPYTLDADPNTAGFQPITGFSAGTATVNILPVLDISDSFTELDPTDPNAVWVDSVAQDWFFVQLEVTGGAVTSFGMGNPVSKAVGMGVGNDVFAMPTSGVLAPSPDDAPEWFFGGGDPNDPNALTGMSNRLIAAYNLGDLPGAGIPFAIPEGTVSFMVNDGSNLFSITGKAVLVPEPSALLLLGVGLAGLAFASRRRVGKTE